MAWREYLQVIAQRESSTLINTIEKYMYVLEEVPKELQLVETIINNI